MHLFVLFGRLTHPGHLKGCIEKRINYINKRFPIIVDVVELFIGTSGWSYPAWAGPFYPENLPNTRWLERYSKVFDYVEVDSSFYAIPSPIRTKKWYKLTPDNFRFTAKMPQAITHEKAFYNVDRELEFTYASMSQLKDKLLCLLIQMPPSISYDKGFKAFRNFMRVIDPRFRYAVEVRHRSWFNDNFLEFLQGEKVALVWNQLDAIQAPSATTTDFIYIRLIGDRSIRDQDFGRIQKNREPEMRYWADELSRVSGMKIGIVAANNHYAGFGPGTANIFRRLMGLQELQFLEEEQAKLTDF